MTGAAMIDLTRRSLIDVTVSGGRLVNLLKASTLPSRFRQAHDSRDAWQ
jgi:hypothetical protein